MAFDDNYDFKHVVVNNQEDFDKYFGAAKTMENTVDKIDFAENSVVAIITKPSNVTKKIDIVYFEFDDDQLFIQYHIAEGAENTYESTGLYLGTIPKGVASINLKSRYNVDQLDLE